MSAPQIAAQIAITRISISLRVSSGLSLSTQSRDVTSREDSSTFFRERGSKAFASGMIGGGFVRAMDDQVDLLGVDNFRLFGLLVEDGVVHRFAPVENCKVLLSIQTNRHSSMAHGISGTWRLDLVDRFAELEGQVL